MQPLPVTSILAWQLKLRTWALGFGLGPRGLRTVWELARLQLYIPEAAPCCSAGNEAEVSYHNSARESRRQYQDFFAELDLTGVLLQRTTFAGHGILRRKRLQDLEAAHLEVGDGAQASAPLFETSGFSFGIPLDPSPEPENTYFQPVSLEATVL